MFSHCRHPMQSSCLTGSDFSRSLNPRTDFGQTPMQREHPLHHALLTSTLKRFANKTHPLDMFPNVSSGVTHKGIT